MRFVARGDLSPRHKRGAGTGILRAAYCGDGDVNATAGETCDTGGESATCDHDCTAVVCGDGVVQGQETCDDGAANTDGWSEMPLCNATCDDYDVTDCGFPVVFCDTQDECDADFTCVGGTCEFNVAVDDYAPSDDLSYFSEVAFPPAGSAAACCDDSDGDGNPWMLHNRSSTSMSARPPVSST